MDYIAIIHKDKDSDYGVSFPDFPGCITVGSTLDEAKDMAIEALTGHIECMHEGGDHIPAPSSLETIMNDPDFADGVAFLVSITLPDTIRRINITAPQSALDIIDEAVTKLGTSRSEFLIKSAIHMIKESKPISYQNPEKNNFLFDAANQQPFKSKKKSKGKMKPAKG